eukprot:TRINITY_DN5749_c0_g1_i1.p1 TRINITY_DN5749_c0_g1~~TRINITY_DN5749_c0_g1_i1.p1  ORF type:complete len:197 (+),score=17.87 TRINITY_DN5749_c0_g1_i1:53-643(+)
MNNKNSFWILWGVFCLFPFPYSIVQSQIVNNSTSFVQYGNITCDTQCICHCNTTDWDPNSPLIPCSKLPPQFVFCIIQDADDFPGGCEDWAGHSGSTPTGIATCDTLEGVTCCGPRSFIREVPCIKYNGHQFPTTLIFALFLGWFGVDRFYLGHCCWGVFKLLTLGGLGVWWFVDLILLSIGSYGPNHGYSWENYW